MKVPFRLAIAVALLLLAQSLLGQRNGRQTSQPATARAAAPIDLTGYWVSVITEDWRLRMITPAKGDYSNIPLNAEGRKIADSWNPQTDAAAGDQCKYYGAPLIMRLPGRFHITWQDDNTLRIDTDNGQQTRLLHFGNPPAPSGGLTWQGFSVASWEFAGPAGSAERAGNSSPKGNLKVVTTHLRPGYQRRNGVPYSESAVLTEYFDFHAELGSEWITHTRILDDPKYLAQPHVLTSHFKREPDASKWNPAPCEIILPQN
jgi:hypothetical protein